MSRPLFFDKDADLALLAGSTVAAIGFGTQGTAQAMNMRDSGLHVIVGAEKDSTDWQRAVAEKFPVMPVSDAARTADVFNLQVPDMAYRCAAAYNEKVKPVAKASHMICVSSAFNYYYGHIVPADGVDAVVAAPKGPGASVRSEFVAGSGVPGLLAVHRNSSGIAWQRGLALCKADIR